MAFRAVGQRTDKPVAGVEKRAAGAADGHTDPQSTVRYCLDMKYHAEGEGWGGCYQAPPSGDRTLEEFESIVLRRMEMLAKTYQHEAQHGKTKESWADRMDMISRGTVRDMKEDYEGDYEQQVYQFFPPGAWAECVNRAEVAAMDAQCEGDIQAERELRNLLAQVRPETGKLKSGDLDEQSKVDKYKSLEKKHRDIEKAKLWKRYFEDDVISHYACRLAFSNQDKWRKWFAETEETLFRGRVRALSADQRRSMIAANNTGAEMLKAAAREGVMGLLVEMERLNLGRAGVDQNGRKKSKEEVMRMRLNNEDVYQVDFTAVPRLVRDKKVVVRAGKALLSGNQVLDLLYTKFKACMLRGLNDAMKARPQIEQGERDRVCAFLDAAVRQCSFGTDEGESIETGSGVVSIEDLATHAERHMPLCMRQMDRHLRKQHHLKFDGRFQYGVFLKRLGLTQEELTKFYGENMTKKGGGDVAKFAKGPYGYSIRHWYGKEGKKTSYSAQGCAAIINGAGPKGEACHGCPFKHSNEETLKQMLRERGTHPLGNDGKIGGRVRGEFMSDGDIQEIAKKATEQHYTAACHMYFEKIHSVKGPDGRVVPYPKGSSLFASPFQYWDASVRWARQKTEEVAAIATQSAGSGGVSPQRDRKNVFGEKASGAAAHSPPNVTGAITPFAPKRQRTAEPVPPPKIP